MMDIVLLSGGLGNQMSQYSFALAKNVGGVTKINTYLLQRNLEHQGYELQKVFAISNKFNKNDDLICRFIRKNVYLKEKIFFKPICAVFFKILELLNVNVIFEKENYEFDISLLTNKSGLNIYWGGWHSEKYYYCVEKQIRSQFKFDFNNLNLKSFELREKLLQCNAISLHVRRGDYMNEDNRNKFGDVCSIDYYENAVNYIKERIETPIFIVFSDDIKWVKNNIHLENSIFVDWNKAEDSWQDMCLISLCKHNINANSTFSWWGAWLNINPNKIVIVPNCFIKNIPTPDFYPETWIKL